MIQDLMDFLRKLFLGVLIISVNPLHVAMAQQVDTILYEAQDTLEIVIPRVFDQEDIGRAYVKSVTGLKGERVVNGTIESRIDTSYTTIFHKFTNGLVLNAWGTGLGMYDKGLPLDTDIRRAQLTIMKVIESDELVEAVSAKDDPGYENPLLLIGIDYGYSFNLSISGPKSRFTDALFEQLEQAIAEEKSIDLIIREHDLNATFALRGILPKGRYREIPVNWQDLLDKYELSQPMPVFGRYLLLEDLNAQTITWP